MENKKTEYNQFYCIKCNTLWTRIAPPRNDYDLKRFSVCRGYHPEFTKPGLQCFIFCAVEDCIPLENEKQIEIIKLLYIKKYYNDIP